MIGLSFAALVAAMLIYFRSFIGPLLLAFIGYAQALLAGRIERHEERVERATNGNQEAQVTRQEAAEARPVTIEAHSVKPEAQLQETSRADAIRKAHKAHPEYTQAQLAQLAGCSRGYVSKVVGNRA